MLRAVTLQTGSIYQRERVTIRGDSIGRVLHALRASGSAEEWLVLSTCGRTEVYAVTRGIASSSLDAAIATSFGALYSGDMPAWRWPLRASGIDAARHLLRVAAGLESIVVGDVQLLGQLRTAYATARAELTTGPLLNRLCQTALHAGKRARAETGIATGASSMAAAAVQLALRDDDGQAKRQFLIVGGGQMGRAIATALHSRRCENVTVATRDPDAFASTGGTRFASVVPRSATTGCLSQADVLFAASGAVTQRLTTEAIARSMAGRDRRPMLILDLAMPRQVDANAASVPGIRLVTLEALERVLSLATRSRSDAVKDVERIVEEALVRMLAWSPHAQHTVSRLST